MTGAKTAIIKRATFLLLILQLVISVVLAQEKYVITGRVKVELGRIEGTYITVSKDAEKVDLIEVDKSGKFELQLDFGHEFILSFSKDGFVTKKMSVSTYVPSEVLANNSQFPPFNFAVSLFPVYEDMDISVFDQPMGLIMYDSELDDFGYDKAYNAQIKETILVAEEKAKLKALQQAIDNSYNAIIAEAEKLIAEKDYVQARAIYKKAKELKPDEEYPRTQIKKINIQLDEIEKLKTEQQAIDEKYNALISRAEKLFTQRNYAASLAAYQEAGELKPDEEYPQQKMGEINIQLAEIDKLKTEQQATDEKYNALISRAEKLFTQKDYAASLAVYQDAGELKPDEEHPKDQIQKIYTQLDDLDKQEEKRKANDEEYKAIIARAEQLFVKKDYAGSLAAYREALELKPEKEYPQNQIQKIEKLLVDFNRIGPEQKSTQYASQVQELQVRQEEVKVYFDLSENKTREAQEFIKNADDAFRKNEFAVARFYYLKAQKIKPQDNYIESQLVKLKETVSSAKETYRVKRYLQAVDLGDKKLNEKHFSSAKHYYNKALSIYSEKDYPLKQLEKIENLLKEQKNQKLKKEYSELLTKADHALETSELSVARFYYKKAKLLMPDEEYPTQKLHTIQEEFEKKKFPARV